VTQLRISEAAELLGVSDDTVRRWAEAGRLATVRGESGRLAVRGRDLAAFLQAQFRQAQTLRAQTLRAQSGQPRPADGSRQSARNQLRGIVTEVRRDGVMAQVDLQCGPFRVVSLMSREAADDLGLEPGVVAVAVVKATNVVVEAEAPTVRAGDRQDRA
jgi:molybdopterin-binding protein